MSHGGSVVASPPPGGADTRCGKRDSAAFVVGIEVGFSMVLRARLLVGPEPARAHRIVATGRKTPEHVY